MLTGAVQLFSYIGINVLSLTTMFSITGIIYTLISINEFNAKALFFSIFNDLLVIVVSYLYFISLPQHFDLFWVGDLFSAELNFLPLNQMCWISFVVMILSIIPLSIKYKSNQ